MEYKAQKPWKQECGVASSHYLAHVTAFTKRKKKKNMLIMSSNELDDKGRNIAR